MIRSKVYKRRIKKELLDAGGLATIYVLLKKGYVYKKKNVLSAYGIIKAFLSKNSALEFIKNEKLEDHYEPVSAIINAQGKFEDYLDEIE